MKLELFDFVDKTLELIENNSLVLNKVASELEKFFNDSFFIKDHFLNVNYRIKSPESLKEKILRHNFYLKYKSPDELVNDLSDLIGFRIECRFMEDEKKIYKEIISLFNVKEENGYYSNPLNSSIMLDLDMNQPQVQKNGFEIYKIDGKYKKGNISVNFELQIKSLVNVFWGDIDHRVLYKNFNYMLTEDFFRDIMSSIKDNLAMIDRQLMLVYNHLNSMDASNSDTKKAQLQALLSKIIHDIYIVKVKQEIGFVVDFKKSTDVIVNYLFMKGGEEETVNYSNNFIRILNRLNDIGKNDINFNEYIKFERELFFNDEFTRKIGNRILEVINKDFRWNLFFKIIFEIEEGKKAEIYEDFIIYLRFKFFEGAKGCLYNKNYEDNRYDEIVNIIMESIVNNFGMEVNIDFINECNINTLFHDIKKHINNIDIDSDWENKKQVLVGIIENYKV